MTNDEMYEYAELLLTFEEECQQLQREIDALKEKQKSRRADCITQERMLLKCVGANIQERIIPIDSKAVIINYHKDGNTLRISNRVVTSEN